MQVLIYEEIETYRSNERIIFLEMSHFCVSDVFCFVSQETKQPISSIFYCHTITHVHVAYFLGLGFGYRQSGLGWSHLQDNHGGTYAHSQMLAGMYLCSER